MGYVVFGLYDRCFNLLFWLDIFGFVQIVNVHHDQLSSLFTRHRVWWISLEPIFDLLRSVIMWRSWSFQFILKSSRWNQYLVDLVLVSGKQNKKPALLLLQLQQLRNYILYKYVCCLPFWLDCWSSLDHNTFPPDTENYIS